MATSETNSITTGASSVTLDGPCDRIEIVNVDGAGYCSFRTDGTTAVIDADNTRVLPAAAGASVEVRVSNRSSPPTISIIASATTKVSFAQLDD